MLRRNFFPRHAIEDKTEETRRRGRRYKQLLDDLKKKDKKLKSEKASTR
jgi:hypothetical protein